MGEKRISPGRIFANKPFFYSNDARKTNSKHAMIGYLNVNHLQNNVRDISNLAADNIRDL